MRQVNLRLPVDIVERVDRVRGGVPRQVWLRRAVENRLIAFAALESVEEEDGPVSVAEVAPALREYGEKVREGMRAVALKNAGLVERRSFGGDLRGAVARPHLPTCRCGVCEP